jgi:hypothetical protein
MHRFIGVGVLLTLLGGCEWLGLTSSTPTSSEKARPGAERQVTVTNALPAARGGQYDASVAPLDENRTAPRLGSVVAGKGGQKAQIEASNKEASERDAKAREERARREREAALKKAQEGGTGDSKGDGKGEKTPVAAPVDAAPPPASVNAAPLAPPPGSAAPVPVAPPAPPSDTKQ